MLGWRWFGGGVDLLVTGAGNRAEHTWFQSTITTTPEKAWFTSTPLPDDSVTKPRLCPCYQPPACSLQSPATAARYATWSVPLPLLPLGSTLLNPQQNHLAIMDPAETDNIKRALADQGALVTKHETTLRQVVNNLQQLATGITDLGGRMDAITGQLTALAHAPPPPPAPVPPPAVAPMVAPREPFIPTPARAGGGSGAGLTYLSQEQGTEQSTPGFNLQSPPLQKKPGSPPRPCQMIQLPSHACVLATSLQPAASSPQPPPPATPLGVVRFLFPFAPGGSPVRFPSSNYCYCPAAPSVCNKPVF
ncbi:protein enabled homolog [Scomber scombrus]|uniref:protein enabled homolog n=1 Tax=Scomber scombrus TaxID=13677 RepID=UPI002DD9060C|nr:protein enabled homolog [Scomber scombrus]